MRAAFIRRWGGPEVLELGDQPAPAISPSDLLVDIVAASLNPVDFKIREGKLRPLVANRLPLILGCDLSGRVAAVGEGVSGWQVGDEVFARVGKDRIGTLAEQIAVRAEECAHKPRSLSHLEAAALPLAGLTAWQALVELGGLAAGQAVLVHAGSGGVGSLAIQIARQRGARVVTTASARNAERLRALGADRVIDYRSERFDACGERFQVIFDTQGGETLARSFALVEPGGIVVSVGASVPDPITGRELGVSAALRGVFWLANAKWRRLAARAGGRYRYLFMHPDGAQLRELASLVDAGKLRPVLDKVFPLDQIAEAFAHLESGRTVGKIVIQM
jgi:alcohol dehydrogenase